MNDLRLLGFRPGQSKLVSASHPLTLMSTIRVLFDNLSASFSPAAVAAAEKCGEGTHLEDGVCILDESSESETVSANTGSVPTEGFNSWIYSITFTLLIAFVIAISLFLISRVRGKKTV